ncbi:MAG: hypothetical protein CVT59_03655 [Actinobacteria bacterium HGW-Actinobacteria-1]|jgi:hypothetical protein|nr:MAG: hypothetical protein CVT59_03655 [Actinobacteria bacterium HGW-Actinobacteria-1]
MFEPTARAYARSSYTIDLPGLSAHALDTIAAYVARLSVSLRDLRVERPRSRVGPALRSHADNHVPDSTRIR